MVKSETNGRISILGCRCRCGEVSKGRDRRRSIDFGDFLRSLEKEGSACEEKQKCLNGLSCQLLFVLESACEQFQK